MTPPPQLRAGIIEDWMIRHVWVDSPAPYDYRAEKQKPLREYAQNLEEAMRSIRNTPQPATELRVFHRVLGIHSLVYIDDPLLARAVSDKVMNGETTS